MSEECAADLSWSTGRTASFRSVAGAKSGRQGQVYVADDFLVAGFGMGMEGIKSGRGENPENEIRIVRFVRFFQPVQSAGGVARCKGRLAEILNKHNVGVLFVLLR